MDLERVKLKRNGQPTSEDLFQTAARQNQLGSERLPSEETENPVYRGNQRYSQVRPFYPRTQMWLRSFEKNRQDDFSDNR